MKTTFVQIEDIAEIDTARISVYDMNKRFIDRAGNMFGLRYNRDAKKIEVIKIMRTTARSQQFFAQKMLLNKKENSGHADVEIIENTEFNPEHIESDMQSDVSLSTETFYDDLFSAIIVFKERVKVIVKNISNVQIIPREYREQSIKLDDMLRNLDIDGMQRLEKIGTSYREMTDYPRSVNSYLPKLDARARSHLTKIPGDESKMKFIISHEMVTAMRDCFYYLVKNLDELKHFVREHQESRVVRLNAVEKQSLSDALVTIDNMIGELHDKIEIVNNFEHQTYQMKFY